MSKTVDVKRLKELMRLYLENPDTWWNDPDRGEITVLDELRSLLTAPVVERQPEPEAFMYQHEETGLIGFVDIQQVEWGFEANNPRLKIICPLFRHPASPPAPVAMTLPVCQPEQDCDYTKGWNACLDKVKELNQ